MVTIDTNELRFIFRDLLSKGRNTGQHQEIYQTRFEEWDPSLLSLPSSSGPSPSVRWDRSQVRYSYQTPVRGT